MSKLMSCCVEIFLVMLILLQYSSEQCLSKNDDPWPANFATNDTDLIPVASSYFALELFKKVATKENGFTDNVLISPISIWAILFTAFVGAHGKTASELATALHIQGVDKTV